jgi:hypothetical protein
MANTFCKETLNQDGAPAPSYATVRISFAPYSHGEVQDLLRKVHRDFGRDRSRWYYRSPLLDLDTLVNTWTVDFCFRDPHDATLFGLKYLR